MKSPVDQSDQTGQKLPWQKISTQTQWRSRWITIGVERTMSYWAAQKKARTHWWRGAGHPLRFWKRRKGPQRSRVAFGIARKGGNTALERAESTALLAGDHTDPAVFCQKTDSTGDRNPDGPPPRGPVWMAWYAPQPGQSGQCTSTGSWSIPSPRQAFWGGGFWGPHRPESTGRSPRFPETATFSSLSPFCEP